MGLFSMLQTFFNCTVLENVFYNIHIHTLTEGAKIIEIATLQRLGAPFVWIERRLDEYDT